MKRKNLAILTTTMAALAMFLTACSGGGSSTSDAKTQTWSRMESDIIASMDSSVVTDMISEIGGAQV